MTPIFGHIKRMESSRLTKQIFEFSENRNKARSETVKWISAIIEDIDVARITQSEITVGKSVGTIFYWEFGQKVGLMCKKTDGTV